MRRAESNKTLGKPLPSTVAPTYLERPCYDPFECTIKEGLSLIVMGLGVWQPSEWIESLDRPCTHFGR